MIKTENTDQHFTVVPEGKITAANADLFRDKLKEIIESGKKQLIIDLKDVDILDSKGLSVFIVCHKTLEEVGGSLTVVTDNPDFQGLFRVMRLDEHFEVRGSEQQPGNVR